MFPVCSCQEYIYKSIYPILYLPQYVNPNKKSLLKLLWSVGLVISALHLSFSSEWICVIYVYIKVVRIMTDCFPCGFPVFGSLYDSYCNSLWYCSILRLLDLAWLPRRKLTCCFLFGINLTVLALWDSNVSLAGNFGREDSFPSMQTTCVLGQHNFELRSVSRFHGSVVGQASFLFHILQQTLPILEGISVEN